jgi:divalent metal cation (Fe/Co/Zn/Cd) transporter
VVLALNLGLVAGLVAVGITAHSLAVFAEGAIILATGGWYWLDPAMALIIAIVIAYHALALLRKVLYRLRTARDRPR